MGDTLAALIRHTICDYIAVEPVDYFYGLLEENIKNMPSEYRRRVRTVQAFVGNETSNEIGYEITAGTAKKSAADKHKVCQLTFSDLISKQGLNPAQCSLIKIDTDGYDSDCILSIKNLKEMNPVIYWENQIENDQQLDSYIDAIGYMSESGYKDYWIFDNFGNFLLKTSFKGVISVFEYLRRMPQYSGARTFYYVDILSAKNDIARIEFLINKYIKKFVKK